MTLALSLRRQLARRIEEGWAGLLHQGREVTVAGYARRPYRLASRERDGLLSLQLAETLRFGPLPEGVSTDGWALYASAEGGEPLVTGTWSRSLEVRTEAEIVVPPDGLRILL